MLEFILFLHFFGLMLGAAGGFASGFIMMRANSAPADQAQTLRGLGWPLAMMSATGLAILWITGIIMLLMIGGPGAVRTVFWVKIVFVVLATVFIGLIHRTYAEMRRTGNAALGQRLMMLGPAAGASILLSVLFASYAFH